MAASKKDMFASADIEAGKSKKSQGKARAGDESQADVRQERIVDLNDEAERRAERLRQEPEAKADRRVKNAGGWAIWMSAMLSLSWLGGIAAFAAGYYTPQQLLALPLPIAVGLCLMVFGTSLMILFVGFVLSESAKTRAMARRLSAAADLLMAPAAAGEASTKRLGAAIRQEMTALDRVVSDTAGRLQGLEQTVTTQSNSLSGAARAVEAQANTFSKVADSLESKAKQIEESIDRHTQRVGDAFGAAQVAARDIEGRVVASTDNLKATSESILAKSEQLTFLAKQVNQKAGSLDQSLESALKTLSAASHLVDAAKASTTMATDASKSAAEAVRGAISDSIERARIVANQIRDEHAKLQDTGKVSFDAIRQSADVARVATETLTANSERRIADLSDALQMAIQRADRAAESRIDQARRVVERAGSALDEVQDRSGGKKAPAAALPPEAEFKGRQRDTGKGRNEESWRWKDVLANAETTPASADGDTTRIDPIDRLSQALTMAGAAPFQAISDSRLAEIKRRGLDSIASRRWAVWDAAPDALRKAKAALSIDTNLREAAKSFLAAENGKDNDPSYLASATGRIFLILDAALN